MNEPFSGIPPTSIQLKSSQDLIEELLRRYDAAVFSGVKFTSKEEDQYTTKWDGSISTVIGVVELLRNHIYAVGDELMERE